MKSKERRYVKKMRNYKKTLAVKPNFLKIFLTRLVVMAIVVMLVYGIGSYIFYVNNYNVMTDALDGTHSNLLRYTSLIDEKHENLSSEEKNGWIKFYLPLVKKSTVERELLSSIEGEIISKTQCDTYRAYNSMSIVITDKNNNIIADSGKDETAFILVTFYNGKKDVNDENFDWYEDKENNPDDYERCVYVCPVESDEEEEEYLGECDEYYGGDKEMVLLVNGNYGDYVYKESGKAKRLINTGYKEKTGNIIDSRHAEYDDVRSDLSERMTGFYEELTETAGFYIGEEVYSVQYKMVINPFYDWGSYLVKYYVIVAIIGIIIAIIISQRTYISRKVRYENEQYRKTITNAMAHDLKSPLMSMSGYIQNILDNTNPDKNQYYLEEIQNAIGYMDENIMNILNLSKSEDGVANIHMGKVCINQLMNECIKNNENKLSERKIETSVEGDCMVKGDKAWILLALNNITSNVIKYATPETQFVVKLSDKEMSFSNKHNMKVVENSKKLLEPFVKGEESRTGQKGTGIGLSIVKNVFESSGFVVDVKMTSDDFCVIIRR